MAVVNKFTATLPNPSETHVEGFVFLLSTQWFIDAANASGAVGSPIDGGAKSLANGGGDMQAYADVACTQQLPLHVVEFVTGGSPSAQIWVRRGSWTAGDTITIAKDDIQTVQPLPSSAYGQYNVWQDYEAVIHANETGTNGVFADVTGNGHDTTLTTGAVLATSSDNPLGGSWPNFTSAEALTLADSGGLIAGANEFTLQVIANYDKTDSNRGVIGNRWKTPDNQWASIQASTKVFTKNTEENVVIGVTQSTDVNYWRALTQTQTLLSSYSNGILVGTDSSISGIPLLSGLNFRIGTYYDNASIRRYQGRVAAFRIARKDLSSRLADEYLNQSDPDNFATISAWVDVGGPATPYPWWLFQEEEN